MAALAVSIVGQPGHETVALTSPQTGQGTHTPNCGWSGAETFTYQFPWRLRDPRPAKMGGEAPRSPHVWRLNDQRPRLYFWRDRTGRKVDALLDLPGAGPRSRPRRVRRSRGASSRDSASTAPCSRRRARRAGRAEPRATAPSACSCTAATTPATTGVILFGPGGRFRRGTQDLLALGRHGQRGGEAVGSRDIDGRDVPTGRLTSALEQAGLRKRE